MMRPQVALQAISVEQKKVVLELLGNEPAQAAGTHELILEVSVKPLMMVVWTGVVLIVLGTALALKRRLSPEVV
jgi:cytochrome c biogenesis factor